jgi:hypothetical protein
VIDFWELAKDFKPSDVVQKYMPGDPGGLSPFVGRVLASHPKLGVVDVQWPFGVDRVTPDELVKVNPEFTRYLPPTLDQSYSSYDTKKANKDTQNRIWSSQGLPHGFHRDLAKLWSGRVSSVLAYDELWRKYTSLGASDQGIRKEVEKFYSFADRTARVRIQSHINKTAAYWTAQNRQYRMTQREVQDRCASCPKCGTSMKRATYKMMDGSKVRLWACPKDLFLVRFEDMLGPDGMPMVI